MRKTIEVLGLMLLGYLTWITYWALNGPNRLPDWVPTHFDISGQPNAWGSSRILWILPVGLGLNALMTALASIQFRSYNLPVRVTEVNLPFIQRKTSEMVAWIKMEILCLFVLIQSAIIHGARTGQFRLSVAIVPGFMVVIFATAGIYLVAIMRGARMRSESPKAAGYQMND